MNRIIRLMMLICIYIFVFSTNSFAAFNDVNGHWCEVEINDFEESSFVDGYLDKTFRPDNDITRAEFCKIINSYMGYDVSGDWQTSNLDMAREKGYLTTGAANDFIPREEAFTVLTKVMNVEADIHAVNELEYLDAEEISVWAKPSVEILTLYGYIEGYEDKLLKPKSNMTRAELVKVLYQYVGVGGLDEEIEDIEFTVGYMTHNKYGLEYVEINNEITINVDDVLMLAATVNEKDGDVKFEILSGNELVEFEKEDLIMKAQKEGKVELKATTTESKKEKNITLNIKK